MAFKIGRYYVTLNNPRELLKTIADKQNIIDEALSYLRENSYHKGDGIIMYDGDIYELEEILEGKKNNSEVNDET